MILVLKRTNVSWNWRYIHFRLFLILEETITVQRPITVTSHERHGIWTHRGIYCLFNSLFSLTTKQHQHSGWTPFYLMYDPKCSTTFPWCTINAPAAFAWCTIHVPAVFAWCTNHIVHKVEFSYIGWNGVHPLWSRSRVTDGFPHKGPVMFEIRGTSECQYHIHESMD